MPSSLSPKIECMNGRQITKAVKPTNNNQQSPVASVGQRTRSLRHMGGVSYGLRRWTIGSVHASSMIGAKHRASDDGTVLVHVLACLVARPIQTVRSA